MKRNALSKLFAAVAGAALCGTATTAHAVPVNALYIEDARCDNIPTQQLPDELGNVAFFPINEAIQVSVSPTSTYICVPDDLIVNDWEVRITNVSNIAWKNLFFAGNLGMTVGNADGNMLDVVGAPGVITDAFRIDGTVTPGVNNNLFFESGTVNEIFEPGEQWAFYVTNFADPNGTSPPPLFNTPGLFAGSAPVLATFPDTASILATPVPEPTTFGLLGLGVAGILMRRPRVARS